MPLALSLSLRQLIVAENQKGKTLRHIAAEYKLSYTTVCRISSRYKTDGLPGLPPHYSRCGGHSAHCPLLKRAALWLKRRHPRWGAPFINVLLGERYRATVPGERTLQRWFRQAGLRPAKGQLLYGQRVQAKRVHDLWQIDAKEKLRLKDGRPLCYLTLVDQQSGSLLDGFVFPPLPFQ
jgi:transposase